MLCFKNIDDPYSVKMVLATVRRFFPAPDKIKEVEMILQAGWKDPQRFY